MNNWLLLIILAIQFFISYLIHGRKFGPSNIMVLTMLIPNFVLIVMKDYIQYELSIETVIIISLLVVLFQVGEIFSLSFQNNIKVQERRCGAVSVKRSFAIIAVVVQLLYVFLGYRYIMQVGSLYGANNFFGAYAANRLNMVAQQRMDTVEIPYPMINVICMYFANAIEIVCLHVILIQKIIMKKKVDKLLLLAVFIYVLSMMFQSGRASFVPFIIHLFFLVIYLSGLSLPQFLKRNKLLVGSSVIIILVFFVVSGSLRSGENIEDTSDVEMIDPSNTVAAYIGAPIIGFDLYVKNGMEPFNYFGEHLFKGVYDIIRKLGVELERPKVHQEFYSLKNFESNAHAGIWYWIRDFSLFGAFVYSLILGSIFGFIYLMRINNVLRLDNIIGCYVVAMFYYALIMTFFGDMFELFFSLDFYFQLLILYVIKRLRVIRIMQ